MTYAEPLVRRRPWRVRLCAWAGQLNRVLTLLQGRRRIERQITQDVVNLERRLGAGRLFSLLLGGHLARALAPQAVFFQDL